MRAQGRERAERRAAGSHDVVVGAIASGKEALERGEWEAARASFEAALRVGEVPAALEGLGVAAGWLDDVPASFDARERAFRLYRRSGDRPGAARVAIALADDYFNVRGEAVVAGGWLRRARRLLDGLPPIPEHGWLNLEEAYFALEGKGDASRGLELAAEGAAIARRLGDLDLEMTAVAIEGLALVLQGRVSDGMAKLDEATTAVVAGELADPEAISKTCCVLVAACTLSRDFERAAEWCHHIKAFSLRMRFGFPLAECRTQYAAVLIWRGAWAEAEEELRAVEQQLGANYPGLRQAAAAALAGLRRRQGRLQEAASMLQQLGAHPLAILGRAALALDRGQAAAAVPLAQRFLRQLPVSNQTDRLAALEVLLQAQIGLGQQHDAGRTLEQLRSVVGQFGTEPMKVSALMAEAAVAAAEGDHRRARNALEDAIDLCVRSGGAFELARCRVELGRVLVACDEREESEAQLAEAIHSFEALGATAHAAAVAALRRESSARPAPAANAHDARLAHLLTGREVDVLRLVAQGMSNHEIARRLRISEFTVKRHVANLLGKLDLPSRAAAAAYAGRAGWT